MAKNIWYYEQNNEPVGPISLRQLKKLVAANKVLPDTMVYKEGLADWQPAGSFGELFYSSYSQVPFYSKHWYFFLIFFVCPIVAIGILIFKGAYYPRKGRVKPFGLLENIFVWGFFLSWIAADLQGLFVGPITSLVIRSLSH